MSRGPSKPKDDVVEKSMGDPCTLCGRPQVEHHPITVHVCYSGTVIRHRLCPVPDPRPS